MHVLKNLKKGRGRPTVSIVCCQHGNERFGLKVFGYFKRWLSEYPGIQIIIANEEAVARNKRFIDQDLNRSYPGLPKGNKETRLAFALLRQVRSSEYVLDVHTTICPAKLIPIVGKLDARAKRIINLTSATNIVRMHRRFAKKSLIGHVVGSISLEFGRAYARKKEALASVIHIVEWLLSDRKGPPKARNIFLVDGVIPLGVEVPTGIQDFTYVRSLRCYPFLIREKAYEKHMRGFTASSRVRLHV